MRRLLPLLLLSLTGCLGTTPDRASITEARLLTGTGNDQLEVTQRLTLSRTMQAALSAGIPLRLVYRIEPCDGRQWPATLELRHSALTRHYELRRSDGELRRFSRRSALLASLDRVRLPLAGQLPADCPGTVSVALDLTSLPTPLRFPAFLQPDEWRLVSPDSQWQDARG